MILAVLAAIVAAAWGYAFLLVILWGVLRAVALVDDAGSRWIMRVSVIMLVVGVGWMWTWMIGAALVGIATP